GLVPAAVLTAKLESESSLMSNALSRNDRKNISSGDSSMKIGSTPSIGTSPSTIGRGRSELPVAIESLGLVVTFSALHSLAGGQGLMARRSGPARSACPAAGGAGRGRQDRQHVLLRRRRARVARKGRDERIRRVGRVVDLEEIALAL